MCPTEYIRLLPENPPLLSAYGDVPSLLLKPIEIIPPTPSRHRRITSSGTQGVATFINFSNCNDNNNNKIKLY